MTALPRFPGAGSLAASIRDRGFLHPRTRHPGNEQRSRRPSCPRIAVPPTVVSRVGAAPARHPEVCCDGLGCVVDGQFFVGADIAACRECVRIGVPHVRVAAVVAVVDGLAGWEDQVDIVVNADGATRTGGIDLNKPRIRAALPAALALTPAPAGFTAAEFTAKVCRLTRPRRPVPSPPCWHCATTSSPPILAGIRSPRMGRKPALWTRIDRRYETLRTGMQDLFRDLGITATADCRIDNILSIRES